MRTHILLVTGLLLLGLAGVVLAVAGEPSPGPGERYVTFTFDDGYASHPYAAERLERRGWRGVFYVPAGLLNGTFEGYPLMSPGAVQALAGAGHEVGGITYRHTNLSTLDREEARTAIDRNRAALAGMGIEPYSFAFPYGVVAHQDVVGERYAMARAGWGVDTAPPEDPLQVRTISLTEGNADILDDYLARLDAGEWLVITLHRIDGAGAVERPAVDVSDGTYRRILDTVENASVTVVTPEDAPWNG